MRRSGASSAWPPRSSRPTLRTTSRWKAPHGKTAQADRHLAGPAALLAAPGCGGQVRCRQAIARIKRWMTFWDVPSQDGAPPPASGQLTAASSGCSDVKPADGARCRSRSLAGRRSGRRHWPGSSQVLAEVPAAVLRQRCDRSPWHARLGLRDLSAPALHRPPQRPDTGSSVAGRVEGERVPPLATSNPAWRGAGTSKAPRRRLEAAGHSGPQIVHRAVAPQGCGRPGFCWAGRDAARPAARCSGLGLPGIFKT